MVLKRVTSFFYFLSKKPLQKPLKSVDAFASKKEIEIEQAKALEKLCKN